MSYLDVNPMMESLRTMPEDFALKGKWLSHRRSNHSFSFDSEGRVQIRAVCECSQLRVMPEQEKALYASFREWEANYWQPLRINREFASHFCRGPSLRSVMIRLATRLASWLADEGHEQESGITEKLNPFLG
jgi:hypothetical protein